MDLVWRVIGGRFCPKKSFLNSDRGNLIGKTG